MAADDRAQRYDCVRLPRARPPNRIPRLRRVILDRPEVIYDAEVLPAIRHGDEPAETVRIELDLEFRRWIEQPAIPIVLPEIHVRLVRIVAENRPYGAGGLSRSGGHRAHDASY